MSIFSPTSIQIYAESVGVNGLSEEVANIIAHDAEYRLREILQEALKYMNHSKRSVLMTNDINEALASRNLEKIYGYGPMTTSSFRPIAVGNVFSVDDQEIDLDEVLKSPFPKMPQRKSYGCHWLAIEGVQPMLPQNPLNTLETVLENNAKTAAPNNTLKQEGETKPLIKHVLPKEQQIYFAQITSLLTKKDDKDTEDILMTIRQGLGLQFLVPYFIQFASETVARYLRNLTMLRRMMKLLKALLDNRHVFVEPYLHQMMPIILTCLVGKRLSNTPEEDHWSLRDLSAQIISQICSSFGNSYATIQPRIAKTLLRAFLDPSKPLATHYGAIAGLTAMGQKIIKHILIPNVKAYGEILDPYLKSSDPLEKFEASKCFKILLNAVADGLAKDYDGEHPILNEEYSNLYGIFGEALVPLILAKIEVG